MFSPDRNRALGWFFSREQSGFSMIELLVAMSVMTILMGLGSYALFSYSRAQVLTGSATQVLTDLRDAQVRAQAEVRTYRVTFNVGADSYQIQRQETTTGACGGTPPCWVGVESRVFLDSTIDLTGASFASSLCGPAGSDVYFCPRGVSSDGSAILRSTRLNQDREIRVHGLSSRSEVK